MIIPCASRHDAQLLYEILLQKGKKNLKMWSKEDKHEVEYEDEDAGSVAQLVE